jgi:hypothetical protein
MRYSSDIIEKANKLLEQHLYCEIDDEELKLKLAVIGINYDDIEDMRETGNANEFEEPFDDDWNPYYGCYNSDFQN